MRADAKEERKEDHWQILFPRLRTVQWQILSKMEVSKIQRSILPIVVFLSPLPSHNTFRVSEEFRLGPLDSPALFKTQRMTGNESLRATPEFCC